MPRVPEFKRCKGCQGIKGAKGARGQNVPGDKSFQGYQGLKGVMGAWVKGSEGLLGDRVFSRTHFRSSLTPEEGPSCYDCILHLPSEGNAS